MFHDMPVTVIGHQKGKNLEENLLCNFGMPNPEGYRKALRLMKQAENLNDLLLRLLIRQVHIRELRRKNMVKERQSHAI